MYILGFLGLAYAVFIKSTGSSNETLYQMAWLSLNNQLSTEVTDNFQTILIDGLMPYPREVCDFNSLIFLS